MLSARRIRVRFSRAAAVNCNALKSRRSGRHRAEAEEAMEALDEIKKAHLDAVKKATNRKKRPHPRQAYIRRETVGAKASET